MLIDPDLARPEGSKYPKGFNTNFAERHPDAKADEPMRSSHDVYALGQLIRREWQYTSAGDLLIKAGAGSQPTKDSLRQAILDSVHLLLKAPGVAAADAGDVRVFIGVISPCGAPCSTRSERLQQECPRNFIL
jgi:hypothetical protein